MKQVHSVVLSFSDRVVRVSQTGVSLVVEAGVGDGEGQQEGPHVPVLPGQQGVDPHHPATEVSSRRETSSHLGQSPSVGEKVEMYWEPGSPFLHNRLLMQYFR